MDTFEYTRLPLGNPEFSDIKTENMIYVDKTKLIAKIARLRVPIFFSRPRRFGKSLLINTLHSLFETGLKYFYGLEIEKIWNDTTYQVVHLDFSDFSDNSAIELKRSLNDTIISEFCVKGEISQYDQAGIRDPDRILSEIVKKSSNKTYVLLVDEYDAPLTHHINEPDELQKITKILNNFYSTIKHYTGKFRFIFITGVTRVSHVSIFSAFNNLLDLSLDDEFNHLLGFTREDLEKYFDKFIENSAQVLGMSKDNIYFRLEQYYDGFQFTCQSEKTLYNPWSILNFFMNAQKGFKNYWFKSGGTSSIIMQYLKINDSFDFISYKDRSIFIDEEELTDTYEINNIPRHILLYQAGYLTIRNIDGVYYLVLPNIEVEESLLQLYLKSNNLSPKSNLIEKMKKLSRDIDEKNILSIVELFNDILNECVSNLSTIFKDERSIRDIIYAALLKIPSLQKIKERESVKGKSDLELVTSKTCMIIEFKRTYQKRGPLASLNEAIKQIQCNRYGRLYSMSHTQYRVAMVISSEKKMILPEFCKEV